MVGSGLDVGNSHLRHYPNFKMFTGLLRRNTSELTIRVWCRMGCDDCVRRLGGPPERLSDISRVTELLRVGKGVLTGFQDNEV